jgi:hypothetical protein
LGREGGRVSHQMKVTNVSSEVMATFTNETIKYTMKSIDESQVTDIKVNDKGEVETEEKS